jgi:hypothetical protein
MRALYLAILLVVAAALPALSDDQEKAEKRIKNDDRAFARRDCPTKHATRLLQLTAQRTPRPLSNRIKGQHVQSNHVHSNYVRS